MPANPHRLDDHARSPVAAMPPRHHIGVEAGDLRLPVPRVGFEMRAA